MSFEAVVGAPRFEQRDGLLLFFDAVDEAFCEELALRPRCKQCTRIKMIAAASAPAWL